MLFKKYHQIELLAHKLNCKHRTAKKLIKKYQSTLKENGEIGNELIIDTILNNDYIEYHGKFDILENLKRPIINIMKKSGYSPNYKKYDRNIHRSIDHDKNIPNQLAPILNYARIKYAEGSNKLGVSSSIYIPTKISIKHLSDKGLDNKYDILGCNAGYNLVYSSKNHNFELIVEDHKIKTPVDIEKQPIQQDIKNYCQKHGLKTRPIATKSAMNKDKATLVRNLKFAEKYGSPNDVKFFISLYHENRHKDDAKTKWLECYVQLRDLSKLIPTVYKLDQFVIWLSTSENNQKGIMGKLIKLINRDHDVIITDVKKCKQAMKNSKFKQVLKPGSKVEKAYKNIISIDSKTRNLVSKKYGPAVKKLNDIAKKAKKKGELNNKKVQRQLKKQEHIVIKCHRKDQQLNNQFNKNCKIYDEWIKSMGLEMDNHSDNKSKQ